jgi:hypothetical protein
MGDDQRGAADGGQFQLGLDGFFRLRIEGRSGLVEDQYRRVLEQRSGDGDPLFLAAGKLEAPLTDAGFIALRQALDEGMQMGGLGGGKDFLAAGVRPAILDVVENRVVEQHRILRDDAYRSS